MGLVDDLRRAREAYERREWVSVYRTLSDLDGSDLTAGDFFALATTAYLLGQRNDCVQALQRAYQANLDQGDPLAAVRSAIWLATVLFEGGEGAIGSGWVARTQRMLDEVEGDVVERGYLLNMQAFGHIMKGELAEAAALSVQVTEYGATVPRLGPAGRRAQLPGPADDLLRAGRRRAAVARRGDGGGARR